MSERIAENRITKINYDPLAKSILPMVVGVVTGNFIDSASAVQQVFNGRFYNVLGVGASWAIAESEIKLGDFQHTPFPFKRGVRALLTRGLGLSVIMQVTMLLDSKPDLGIYIPFIVGAVGGQAIHLGAKALYDSGLTAPIYSMLGIQDRRLRTVNNFSS